MSAGGPHAARSRPPVINNLREAAVSSCNSAAGLLYLNHQKEITMSLQPMKIPGPDHPIAISPSSSRIVVKVGGHVVADSHNALTLKEATYPPVYYIPRSDVDLTLVERTHHHSHCPYKGEASYYSIPAGGERSENAIWTYEAPYAAASEIKSYFAFYPDRVDTIEELPG
jgi:uncharacterized protein (DUF427 family)